jgi:hypothetical protein
MAAAKLGTSLRVFSRRLAEARELANDAHTWSIPVPPRARALITARRRDILTEVAFLRAFTSWEIFLEETFLLYLLGHKPPRGAPPRRYGFPRNQDAAVEWCTDGKGYAKWNVSDVQRRANRWFRYGKPFTPALQGQQSRLDQLVTIRNAIAHESSSARSKFEALVRRELGALPQNTTVGSFLNTTKPNFNPPISFLEFYVNEILRVAQNIVPP